jgi:8-oxo-dGTP pyrophosphatase MutT (NUDIX family)
MPTTRTHTWDGLPRATEPPFGCLVVVYRRSPQLEILLLHRANQGEEGDWAWTPPSGCRTPGEAVEDCAARELAEEAGLALPVRLHGADSHDWYAGTAEAPPDAEVRLVDPEHDRYRWADLATVRALVRPDLVLANMERALATLGY